MSEPRKVIIIGSGPAGLTAAIYAARAELNPLVFEGAQPGGQLTITTEVENYPGFPESITGTELVMQMREQAERFGTRYLAGSVVKSDFSGKPFKLTMEDGQVIESRIVIIATGASAMYLGIETEQKHIGRGVSGCATCDGAFYRDEQVVVIGGGDTAMEDALFLTRFAEKVTVIHRRDDFRASKIMGDRVKNHEKIEVLWDSVVEEVMGVEENTVKGVKVRNTKTDQMTELPVTGFFVAIGHKPNSDAFKGQIDMDDNGFIITDNTKTNIEGVYACGDVQDHIFKQAVTAAGTGCMAALEATRSLEKYDA